MPGRLAASSQGRIVAVLGPTNTGKTHLAVERMLGHRSGVIGLPLRLLAREIYDRVVAQRGARVVALITGEEKIVPPQPAYFVCTVEAMPPALAVDFLAIDEIQLAADPERGHVFTDRLLRARGIVETMFLGADTMRGVLRRLLPEAEFVARPRFSELSYAGERKLSRLPRRSAVVAFSAAEVYALAELVRRQRGGAAVVLGALSPRTRNAQVALFQSGEVDYLVATDAVGMGLNMQVDHIAFAGLRKFDGLGYRELTPAEIGQVAGRAGRYMNPGTFGVTAGAPTLEPELVERIEAHRFDAVRRIQWRNPELDDRSVDALLAALTAPPPDDVLSRGRDADDYLALRAMREDREMLALADGAKAVRLLWEVCGIPDFRKTSAHVHHNLLKRIYGHLREPPWVLPTDWVTAELGRLDRTEGDIDTLAGRIAHVRTWTYVSHRADWLRDARARQEEARALEDKLSDALHQALTQRFVDRRTSALIRGLKAKQDLLAAVGADGEVLVEGHFLGRLHGLSFTPDAADAGVERRTMMNAANRVLAGEVGRRACRLADGDGAISWREDNRLWWQGAPVARLAPGADVLRPQVELLPVDHLDGALRERVRRRLADWLAETLAARLAPLGRLEALGLDGAARGLAFQLAQGLGALAREPVAALLQALSPEDRRRLGRAGVRLGYLDVFLPAMLRPERAATAVRLWTVAAGLDAPPPAPPAGAVSLPADPALPPGLYGAAGYRVCGGRAVRIDMLDRLATLAHARAAGGAFVPDHAMLSLLGLSREELDPVLRGLGYRAEPGRAAHGAADAVAYRYAGRRPRRGRPPALRSAQAHSPFAGLARLVVQEAG